MENVCDSKLMTHPSYDVIHQWCTDLRYWVQREGFIPEVVVGIARGGIIPAVILSHISGIPMDVVSYSSKSGAGDDRNHKNVVPQINQTRILLVDDICDTGKTMAEVTDIYLSRNHKVVTASLYWKEGSFCSPDWWGYRIPKDAPWIVFPWEE